MRGAGIFLKRSVHLLIYEEECLEGSADESSKMKGTPDGCPAFLFDSGVQTRTLTMEQTWEGIMNFINVRLTALLTIVIAFATWSYCGFWLIGSLVMLGIVTAVLLFLGKDTDTEKEDLRADLIRQALILKVLTSGTRAGTILGGTICATLLCVLAANAFHQVKAGSLTILQGISWWISEPVEASVISAFCGFCAGSVYYLLMRWTPDLKKLRTCNEMQLLHEAARQRKRLRFAL